ncbi:hypothetical protein BJ875DRAFT_105525 [Amylocarpus encephaloides]|uniref:Uncharacterized protein n=1 Tax=Amylocarpus encephaloides TaxID=45428 RepID=A0A9P7YED2_9HELO|nr:hypothetical protein BJ875DRAFT_105525 [Amylocarpus encephaloides]
MSGSGGYYKYRCKYFFTHNCPHWVWVHNAPCAHCLADGRDSEEAVIPTTFRLAHEIYVPQFENGAIQYIIFDIISNSPTDSGWTVKEKPTQGFPTATGPSAVRSTVAVEGMDSQKPTKNKLRVQSNGIGWSGRSHNFE